MFTALFYVLLLLPSFACVFAVLAALYDARRAYVALSWVPPTLFVLVRLFEQLSKYARPGVNWHEILLAVAWTGLAQCLLGFALAARAARLRQSWVGLLLASCLAGTPYLFRP